ncbi:hypothetical protein AAZX31_15G083700 [Glycine max]
MAFSLFIPNQPFTLVPTLLLLVLLHASLCEPLSRDGSTRHLFESRNTKHHPNNCGELVAQSQCSQNSKCSWCTSEDLDDMCFSFATTGAPAEAWRLPQQVYSCSLIR